MFHISDVNRSSLDFVLCISDVQRLMLSRRTMENAFSPPGDFWKSGKHEEHENQSNSNIINLCEDRGESQQLQQQACKRNQSNQKRKETYEIKHFMIKAKIRKINNIRIHITIKKIKKTKVIKKIKKTSSCASTNVISSDEEFQEVRMPVEETSASPAAVKTQRGKRTT